MSDRGIYSVIDRIIREGKQRISDRDRAIVGQVLGAYEESRGAIAAELFALEDQILWSIENNRGELTEAWLRRQDWYQRLDATIEREAVRLEASTRRMTANGMAAGVAEGGITGSATIRTLPWISGDLGPASHLIAAIQPGTPLDRVLTQYGANVEAKLKGEITHGLIRGDGSNNIVRKIIADVGDFIPVSDASRIVRTETMRAYRGAYKEQMDTLTPGMISGYRWMSALDMRTCPICAGLHGHVFEEYPNYFHVSCRCVISPVFSPRYAPPRESVTGDEWLANQPEDVQRSMLGPTRYELWKDGGVPMRSMIRFERDPVWGGSARLIPVKDLRL